MASDKIYRWFPTQSDTTYRELISEMLRMIVPVQDFPLLPRRSTVAVKTITQRHRELHDIVKANPDDVEAVAQLNNAVLWIDCIWTFLETWCVMEWPGAAAMRDRHNLIDSIHYDISGPDAMFAFFYEGGDYVNAYIDEDCLRKKIDFKKFRQTVHFANRGKKN